MPQHEAVSVWFAAVAEPLLAGLAQPGCICPPFVAFTEVAATPLAILVFEGEMSKGQGLDWGGSLATWALP